MTLDAIRKEADANELAAFQALHDFIHGSSVEDHDLLEVAGQAWASQVWLRTVEADELRKRLYVNPQRVSHT